MAPEHPRDDDHPDMRSAGSGDGHPDATGDHSDPDDRPDAGHDRQDTNDGYSVAGMVTWPGGLPASGVAVRAYARGLRREQPLGQHAPGFATETRTDPHGRYRISYRPQQSARAERGRTDLVVRALDGQGGVAAVSPTVFDAPRHAEADLVLPARVPGLPSEYERLVAQVAPFLDEPPPAGLSEVGLAQVGFLAGAAGYPAGQLTALVMAVTLSADDTGTQAAVPPEAYYGLIRMGDPADAAGLGALSAAKLAADLRQAVRAGIAPAALGEQADAVAAGVSRVSAAVTAQQTAQGAELAQPSVRYATTGSTANPLVDARLDAALRSAVTVAWGTVSAALSAAASASLAAVGWRSVTGAPPPAAGTATPPAAEAADPATDTPLPASSPTVTIAEVATSVLTQAAAADPAVADEAATVTQRLGGPATQTVSQTLHLDTTVRDNPLLLGDVAAATTGGLARLAGLPDAAVTAVTAAAPGLSSAPEAALGSLVASQALTADQAGTLRTMLSLSDATDGNLTLLQAITSQGAQPVPALAAWTPGQWTTLLDSSAVTPPPGTTTAGYAATIAANLELAYPTQALAARLAPGNGPLTTFFTNNPDLDLRNAGLVTGDTANLDWQGISRTDQPQVTQALRSCQRLLVLADTTDDRAALAGAGLDSALAISGMTADAFASVSGLDPGTARVTYARAQNLALGVANAYGALHDILAGPYKSVPVANAGPQFLDDLLKIDGVAQLFGSQDFCDCGDCQSVLSPAAYFVDLMHFVDEHISTPVFVTPGLPGHPLYLKNRRPDLWTLPLTCDNTNTLIPYLTVVDEVLEAALASLLGQDPYQVLSDPANKAACQVPFTLPFAELGLYLGYFRLSPADIYRTLQLPAATVNRAAAGLSRDSATVVTTADPAGAVQRLGLASAASLTDLPVQSFTERTGITRQQLTGLLASRSDPDLAQVSVTQQSVPSEIQDFPEVLANLTADRADRALRFLRLAQPLGWALTDLDLLLLAAQQAGLATAGVLDASVVNLAGRLVTVQRGTSLSVQQLCAVIGDMPVSAAFPLPPVPASAALLYEQVFNLAAIFGVANQATGELNQVTDYYHYSLDTTLGSATPVTDPGTPLLLAGLGVSETDLLLLFDLVKADMPFTANGHCTLDRSKLSLLYRQVLTARMLGLGIPDLIAALTLALPGGAAPVTTLAEFETLQTFGKWLAPAVFSVGQLQLIISGTESTSVKYATTPQTVAALVQGVQAAVPPGGPSPDPVTTLQAKLCAGFTIGAGRLSDLLSWTGLDTTAPAVKAALAATFTQGVPDNPALLQPLTDLVRRLERAVLLFAQMQTPDTGVHYLTAQAAALGIADRATLTLANVQALAAYTGFATRTVAPAAQTTPIATATATGSGADAASLTQALLDAYGNAGSFGPDDRPRLADLLAADPSLVASVLTALTLPTVPIDALRRVEQVLAPCQTLGVNAYSLLKLGDDTGFAALSTAAQVALGAIGAQYTDDSARDQALEPYQDSVNTIKRDALCGYLIDGLPQLRFTSHADLYDYFLLDVDTSGCTRTSRVVAAISSVQLYVQRCQTGLEQSDPSITSVTPIRVDPTAVPAVEWAWRQNFRVWQANRKVFLYPESYLVPDLRDDKTPAFKDLEDNLLQAQITGPACAGAYASYLSDLAGLAHLRICGSFYDAPNTTYYFFGRTQQDPPSYCYRSWDTTTWSPWTTIDLPIDGPYVSATMHLGRLMVFWVDGTTKDHTAISGGSSSTDYYTVTAGLVYSVLQADGTWRPPQKLDWLYPSGEETTSAVDQVFSGPYPTPEDNVAAMALTKTYRKAYPAVPGSGVVLAYYNPTLSPYYYVRDLDLFHNRLVAGGNVETLGPATVLGTYAGNTSTAQLGVQAGFSGHELDFDLALEQGNDVVTPHTLVTTPYPYDDRDVTDPGKRFYQHAVNQGFPESVVQLGDQQFLVMENHLRLSGPSQTLASPGLSMDTAMPPAAQGAGASEMSLRPASGLASLAQFQFVNPVVFMPVEASRRLVRLSTSVADMLGETDAASGLDQLMDLSTQQAAVEQPLPFSITVPSELAPPDDDPNHIDLRGAFGSYFQELYLHIPWLAASQLNAGGQYADAMRWFEFVFNPTAPPSSSDATPADRNWRYAGFRGLSVPTLQQILTDPAALDAYRNDPFNPFAIARLRPSAFQKAVVMQFVGNLLDWGDSLFAQDTTESVNEATMLYMYASEVLGPRPVSLGECQTLDEDQLTYEAIGATLSSTSDFLVTLENWTYQSQWFALSAPGGMGGSQPGPQQTLAMAADTATTASTATADTATTASTATASTGTASTATSGAGTAAADSAAAAIPSSGGGASTAVSARLLPYQAAASLVAARAALPAIGLGQPSNPWFPPSVVTQTTLVFCVPPNDVLLALWDRLDDRLFKIRNCMNISGVRRQLALFAPPVNPMDLVRAGAAGLSIEEATAALTTQVPVYRFSAIIDRARQAAQMVATFGSALLSALERKDTEELTLLESVHQRTILQMTTDVKTGQVAEAQYLQQAAADAVVNVANRVSYYQSLIDSGLTGWEQTEEVSRHAATALRLAESVVHLQAAITYLVPQVGSPFAMKYGGVELGHSGVEFAQWTSAMAAILDAVAASASLEAGFDRRQQEWNQQLTLAKQDSLAAGQQQLAAAARATYAQRELEIHQTSIDQAAELDAFCKGKFTGLGLFTYLSRSLTTLHRQAYDAAYQQAMGAQRAYAFETDDDTVFIAPDNWEGDKAGLLSGERLLVQLQQLENAYLAGNTRRYEVTQHFPLSVVAPGQLANLRETGTATFDLPEVLFDIAYPGQYKRVIKSVRLTIPGVTGPYTSVAAKLTLTASSVRSAPSVAPAALSALPTQPNIASAIATSTGVSDAGLFELNFRDERYLPFEGAGAVSGWRLDLPAQLRSFDYRTVSDVVVHLSYTALDDDVFRDTVESGIVTTLTDYAATTGLFRLLSLRHDFPAAFHQLTGGTAPANQATSFPLTAQHFPYFLSQRTLSLTSLQVMLVPLGTSPVNPGTLTVSCNGAAGSAWAQLSGTDLMSSTAGVSGPVLTTWTVATPSGHIDPTQVADVLLLVGYRAA